MSAIDDIDDTEDITYIDDIGDIERMNQMDDLEDIDDYGKLSFGWLTCVSTFVSALVSTCVLISWSTLFFNLLFKYQEEQEKGKYFIKPSASLHEGILEVNSQGNGYLISDEFEEDVFIDRRHFNKAFHGDTVSFKIMASKGKRRKQGIVFHIIKRQKTQYVGVIEKFDDTFSVQPKNINLPFLLSKENIGKIQGAPGANLEQSGKKRGNPGSNWEILANI